jgi:hypothetical protein
MNKINRKHLIRIASIIIWIGIVIFIIIVFTLPKGESPTIIKNRLDSLFQCQTPEILKILKYESSIAIDDFCDKYTIQYTNDDFKSLMDNINLSKWQGNNVWKQKTMYLNSMYNQVLVSIQKDSSIIEIDFCHE